MKPPAENLRKAQRDLQKESPAMFCPPIPLLFVKYNFKCMQTPHARQGLFVFIYSLPRHLQSRKGRTSLGLLGTNHCHIGVSSLACHSELPSFTVGRHLSLRHLSMWCGDLHMSSNFIHEISHAAGKFGALSSCPFCLLRQERLGFWSYNLHSGMFIRYVWVS